MTHDECVARFFAGYQSGDSLSVDASLSGPEWYEVFPGGHFLVSVFMLGLVHKWHVYGTIGATEAAE